LLQAEKWFVSEMNVGLTGTLSVFRAIWVYPRLGVTQECGFPRHTGALYPSSIFLYAQLLQNPDRFLADPPKLIDSFLGVLEAISFIKKIHNSFIPTN
jgi:hypothetical protein